MVDNKQYQQDFAALKKYTQLQSKEDVINFEHLIWKLADTKDLNVLKELFEIFDDDCEYDEIMYGLIHRIETYPHQQYIQVLLKNLNIFLPKAINWLERLLYRILNHDECLQILSNNLQFANKQNLQLIFAKVYEESEHHRPVIDELRIKLNEII